MSHRVACDSWNRGPFAVAVARCSCGRHYSRRLRTNGSRSLAARRFVERRARRAMAAHLLRAMAAEATS
jgi:hypothetical protein